ncbi:MAG TPA: GH3 auxin-responsive promoter family protein [Hanamia sp.]|nr:GH3 auxin-responsive promoter family protein [Hanamia sp.]
MAFIDIKLPRSLSRVLNIPESSPRRQQLKVLQKLLKRARFTEFGQKYLFDQILLSRHPGKNFQLVVPTFNYETIFKKWWFRALDGKRDICWPGAIKFFALSSGTSESSSKYIPITRELIRANTLTSFRQLISLASYNNVPKKYVGKGWLMLGGSTHLQKSATYYAGDLSGIQAKNIPFWFQGMYKPGKKIAREPDWSKKLDEIVEKAPEWDIAFLVGVPAWVQLCMEKVIERYKLKNIHEIWPNLAFYVHGGVALEPYKKGFNRLLGKPITYIETYLASEGFLAYQSRQNAEGMKLAINNNIFFEFIPFDQNNFDSEGNMVANPETLMIHEVEKNKNYAMLISTNAGTWRYLIGDTVQFTDVDKCEIIITGRTRHFLSMVGEHLSVDNMNKAIQLVSDELNISIGEFTVAGVPYKDFFAHHWYIATDDKINPEILKFLIDEKLKELNDDYEVERKHALKEVFVDVLSEKTFMNFMKSKNKVGGQNKFPRVLKGKMLDEWQKYLKGVLV